MGFQQDIDAAVKRFGVKDIGLIWGLGTTPWDDDDQRDAFLDAAKKSLGQNG